MKKKFQGNSLKVIFKVSISLNLFLFFSGSITFNAQEIIEIPVMNNSEQVVVKHACYLILITDSIPTLPKDMLKEIESRKKSKFLNTVKSIIGYDYEGLGVLKMNQDSTFEYYFNAYNFFNSLPSELLNKLSKDEWWYLYKYDCKARLQLTAKDINRN
jgi:hypothetical protein